MTNDPATMLDVALDKLDFDEIRVRLAAQCLFSVTSELAMELYAFDRPVVGGIGGKSHRRGGVDLLTSFPTWPNRGGTRHWSSGRARR